ncbi:universal stress protein [Pseudanabaena sp. PCC 6802]|uniref:universal stress protein n=1 Tax=Pseudanabaena sp. PCC 6802 TaxID=118173 RepID=UPI0003450561|nr:universal stress protein [Pseudanabaena sp. PCC 6802]
MFNKILAAIDASECSKQVFETALSLAKLNNAELMLLHVISPLDEGYPTLIFPGAADVYPSLYEEAIESYKQQWQEFEQQGLDILRSLASQARELGVTVEFRQPTGDPGKNICNIARSWEAGLIVVGRRGHKGLSELLLGSVSNYVLHHAPCSVLTLQGIAGTSTESDRADAQVVGATR